MMDVAEYYCNLHKHSESVLHEMLADRDALEALTTSQNYLLGYERMQVAISDRPEKEVISAAVKEYQFALFALSVGQYRHAFVGLRLFFELMLVTVQFSAHEIDYRLWAKDAKDINWGALKDTQTGVFSANFINAFNPSFSGNAKQYLAIAETVYRECSEFVHGNANTHISLTSDIVFNKEIFLSWHQKAEAMRMVVIFVFSARYLNYINPSEIGNLEPIISDVIGHLPAVQAVFSIPYQGVNNG